MRFLVRMRRRALASTRRRRNDVIADMMRLRGYLYEPGAVCCKNAVGILARNSTALLLHLHGRLQRQHHSVYMFMFCALWVRGGIENTCLESGRAVPDQSCSMTRAVCGSRSYPLCVFALDKTNISVAPCTTKT